MIFSRRLQKKTDPGDAKSDYEQEVGGPEPSRAAVTGINSAVSQAPIPARKAQDDALANDLIRRVIHAMDDWAQANGLNAVPRHIIFEQLLSILNAMDRNFATRD